MSRVMVKNGHAMYSAGITVKKIQGKKEKRENRSLLPLEYYLIFPENTGNQFLCKNFAGFNWFFFLILSRLASPSFNVIFFRSTANY